MRNQITHLAPGKPLIPVWVINLALTLLIASLWPISKAVDQYMDAYYLRIVILVGINVILASSLNLINGITGQFSLGHAGFMAIGAYGAGSLMIYYHPTESWSGPVLLGLLVAGGLLAALFGLIVGIPALRLRGDYLAVATLGFGEIIFTLINQTDTIGPLAIGGSSGLHRIPIVTNFFWTYACALVCVVCVWRMAYSTKGIAFRAIREDEIAAAAMGVDTTFYKVAAFTIGAFFAGVAGGLSASYDGNVDPGSFRFMKSIDIVVMVVLGGSGSVTGAILAAIILTLLPEFSRRFQEYRMIVYSLLLIIMMLVRPGGLMGYREIWMPPKRKAAA